MPFAPLRFLLETQSAFRGPAYKGSLFRGGFGAFYREWVCETGLPACEPCELRYSCRYSTVFETPVAADAFPVLRKYPSAPHPFVMVPPEDEREAIPAGAVLTVGVTLIGFALQRLVDFVEVMGAMGASGRYGGRYRVLGVVSALDARAVYDAAQRRWLAEPPLWAPSWPDGAVEELALRFRTPLRMRTGGVENAKPDFVDLTKALTRRVHLLASLFGGATEPAQVLHPLLALADRSSTVAARWERFAWQRRSGRQQREIRMDGVLGELRARGELAELAPFYEAGQWLHIGNGTGLGLGGYRLERRQQ